MQRLMRWMITLPSLLLILPAIAGPLDLVDPDKVAEDPKVRLKLLQADFLTGKLTAIEGEEDAKTFTLEVMVKAQVVNQEAKRKMIEIQNAGVRTKDQGRIQQLVKEYADWQKKLYEVQEVPYVFELKSGKDLNVRRQKLPPKEEDGKTVAYTKDELAKLKGENAKLPGYTAEAKDLDKDIQVRVYLDKAKVKLPVIGAKAKPKEKKDEPEEPAMAMAYPVLTIMILPPPADSPLGNLGGGDPAPPMEAPEGKPDPKVRAKMLDAAYIDGKLSKCDVDDEHGLVLEVAGKVRVVNPEWKKKYEDFGRQYNDLLRAGKQNEANNLVGPIKEAQSKYYEVKEVTYEFPLEMPKEAKVRVEKLPPKEEDGKPVKYTADELAKAKGDDPKTPGYTASLKDLDKDVPVRVYLDRAKVKAMPKPKPGEEPSDEPVYYSVVVIMIKAPPPEGRAGLPGLGK